MPGLVHLSFWVLVFHVELCVDCSVQWLVIVSYCQLDISSTMNVNGKENHKHGMRKTFFIWCWFSHLVFVLSFSFTFFFCLSCLTANNKF